MLKNQSVNIGKSNGCNNLQHKKIKDQNHQMSEISRN